MLKKLKEIFGFPTEQEKAAAKEEVKSVPAPVADNIFAFPTSDKPEVETKPKAKRTPKPKVVAEKAPVKKAPAKKPAVKKTAPKVEAAAPKRTRKPKAV
jgi:hypothetical protein